MTGGPGGGGDIHSVRPESTKSCSDSLILASRCALYKINISALILVDGDISMDS